MTQATLHTNHGDIVIELFPNHAPETVSNFVGLATGEKEWTDPRTGAKSNEKDRKSTRLNSSHTDISRMPSSA